MDVKGRITTHEPDRLYRFTIDGEEFESSDSTLTPSQLKAMASRDPAFIVFKRGRNSESDIRLVEGGVIDLTNNEFEHFITRSPESVKNLANFRIQVGVELYESDAAKVSGQQVRAIAGLGQSGQLYLERQGQPDLLVGDSDVIDLSQFGSERFRLKREGEEPQPQVVQITVTYTSTARTATFQAKLKETVEQVVGSAYTKLGEPPRPGDTLFTSDPRVDLTPLLTQTLRELRRQGLVKEDGSKKTLSFDFDIETATGGA